MRQAQTVKFDRNRWQAVTSNWSAIGIRRIKISLNLLFSELNLLLQQGLYRLSDMATACENLSYTHFSHIVANLFKPMRVTGFLCTATGNNSTPGNWLQLIQANTR